MKKRIICLLIVAVLALQIVGCTEEYTPPNTQSNPTTSTQPTLTSYEKVEELIESIGYVFSADLEFETKILKAEEEYNKLNSADKSNVSNYNDLVKARKYYDYYEYLDEAYSKATSNLKYSLKNPSSLQVHSKNIDFVYDSNLEKPLVVWVTIDYSAQNGFGGYNRDKYTYIRAYKNGVIQSSTFLGEPDYFDIKRENNGVTVFGASSLDK